MAPPAPQFTEHDVYSLDDVKEAKGL